jgi:hypothetical protein
LRSSLDAYLTYTEIDGYAKKDLLDAYLTFLDIDGYQKTNATHIAYYTAYLATSNNLSLFTIKSADFSVAPANQPGTPSCVRMAFGTPWDGGDILITGIDARGSSTTETIGGATSGAVFGLVPWAYISNIQNTGHRTTGSVTGYYLYRIGLPHVKIEKPFAVYRNGVWDGVSASSGYSSTYGWVRPTTTPDGTATYLICYRYSEENDFDSD